MSESNIALEQPKPKLEGFTQGQLEALRQQKQKVFDLRQRNGTKDSLTGQVAIDPDNPFLKGAENKTLGDQISLAQDRITELSKKVPEIKGVLLIRPEDVEAMDAAFRDSQAFNLAEPSEVKGLLRARGLSPQRWSRVITREGVTASMTEINGRLVSSKLVGPDRNEGVAHGDDRSRFVSIMVGIVPASAKVPSGIEVLPRK